MSALARISTSAQTAQTDHEETVADVASDDRGSAFADVGPSCPVRLQCALKLTLSTLNGSYPVAAMPVPYQKRTFPTLEKVCVL
jgi:hypothetical protein